MLQKHSNLFMPLSYERDHDIKQHQQPWRHWKIPVRQPAHSI